MGILLNGFTTYESILLTCILKGDFLMDNKKALEEAKQLNQQSKQSMPNTGMAGGMTSSINSSDLQEAVQLNQQSRQGSASAMTSSTNMGMTSGVGSSDLEEAKKLNQQSRQSKK